MIIGQRYSLMRTRMYNVYLLPSSLLERKWLIPLSQWNQRLYIFVIFPLTQWNDHINYKSDLSTDTIRPLRVDHPSTDSVESSCKSDLSTDTIRPLRVDHPSTDSVEWSYKSDHSTVSLKPWSFKAGGSAMMKRATAVIEVLAWGSPRLGLITST